MPRKARTQRPVAAPGQQYGMNQDQIKAQQVMPLPDRRGPVSSPVGAAPLPGGAAPQPPDALAAAEQMQPPPEGGMLAASGRPDEPITAGLDIGPGPGSSAIQGVKPPPGSLFVRMAQISGDPLWLRMAQQAGYR